MKTNKKTNNLGGGWSGQCSDLFHAISRDDSIVELCRGKKIELAKG